MGEEYATEPSRRACDNGASLRCLPPILFENRRNSIDGRSISAFRVFSKLGGTYVHVSMVPAIADSVFSHRGTKARRFDCGGRFAAIVTTCVRDLEVVSLHRWVARMAGSHRTHKGVRKVSGTFSPLPRSPALAQCTFQAQLPHHFLRPGRSAEGASSIDATPQCLEFGLGLRRVDVLQPMRSQQRFLTPFPFADSRLSQSPLTTLR